MNRSAPLFPNLALTPVPHDPLPVSATVALASFLLPRCPCSPHPQHLTEAACHCFPPCPLLHLHLPPPNHFLLSLSSSAQISLIPGSRLWPNPYPVWTLLLYYMLSESCLLPVPLHTSVINGLINCVTPVYCLSPPLEGELLKGRDCVSQFSPIS